MNRSVQHAFEHEEIMAYLDGELEPGRASSLAAHLDHCAECRLMAAGLRRVSDQLAAWEGGPAPSSLSTILEKAGREQTPRKSSALGRKLRRFETGRDWLRARPWAWGVAGAVATALLFVTTVSVLQYSRDRGIASSKTAPYKQWLQTDSAIPGNALTRKKAESAVPHAPAPTPPITDGRSPLKTDSNGLLHGLGDHAGDAFANDGQPPVDAGSMGKLRASEQAEDAAVNGRQFLGLTMLEPGAEAPMVARTAALSVVAKDFAPVEAAVKEITARHHGYIGELSTSAPKDAARNLSATLRIPVPQLDGAIAELKQLGRVEQESQSGEEVSKQYIDLAVRLKNARVTEQRLVDVLQTKTGKVKDILDVEKEIARVRGEIEQMEADQRDLKTRVDYATLQLTVSEDFRASLEVAPPSTATRLHNAVVQGYHDVIESLIGFAVWLLAVGPALLIWGSLLFFPARWAWKRWRRTAAAKASPAGAA